MFEVMTLVTCDGSPGGRGWVAGDQPPAQRKEMGPRVAGAGRGRRRRVGDSCGGGSTPPQRRALSPRPPDSLPRGPVSTALTSTSQPPKHPAEIVGILRLILGAQHRCRVDVSAVDTSDLPDLFPPRIAASRTTSPPRAPARASASEVITPTCLRSEETAHLTGDSRRTQIADEEAVRADQEVRTAPRVSIPGLSTLQPWFSRAKRVWSASVDRTSTVGPAPEMTAG